MVKIQDGSLVFANELLSGAAEDDEGKPLKFLEVLDAPITTFVASTKMTDGSERTRFFSFGLADTKVRVSVITKTPEEIKAEEQLAVAAKREADEAAAKTRSKALEATQKQQQQQQPPKTEKVFKQVSVTKKESVTAGKK